MCAHRGTSTRHALHVLSGKQLTSKELIVKWERELVRDRAKAAGGRHVAGAGGGADRERCMMS